MGDMGMEVEFAFSVTCLLQLSHTPHFALPTLACFVRLRPSERKGRYRKLALTNIRKTFLFTHIGRDLRNDSERRESRVPPSKAR